MSFHRSHFLDLASLDQVFHAAIYFKAPFQLEYCSYTIKTYTSSGLHFGPLKDYSSVEWAKEITSYCLDRGMDMTSVA